MIRRRVVQYFVKQAQKSQTLGGLYGIFAETDLECEALWCYIEECTELSEDVVKNTPQREVTFRNGARVRVFCASWRTFWGMLFNDVLLSDDSLRQHVYSKILYAPPKSAPEPPLRFGL